MTFRRPVVRSRLAALIACSLVATTIAGIVPLTATAEYGIAPGSGAAITAGQPLLVRVTPGWDAEVAYEIADGSYVTVWDVAQAAPDGSMWYPVDGGFVPVDGVTSMATLEGGVALYQEAAPAATDTWVDPNQAQGWIDPATGLWVAPAQVEGWIEPNSGEWVEPLATEGWIDPNTGEWVEPVASEGWVDPNTGEWVEPAAADGWIDPNTGEWVSAAPVDGWVDSNTGEWVTAAPVEGWIDANTGEWVQAEPYVELAQEVPGKAEEWVQPEEAVAPAASDGWVDPATGEWVEAAPTDGWVDPNTGEWVAAPLADQPVETAPAGEWVEPAPVDTGKIGGVEPWGEPIATAYIAGTDGDGAACRAGAERATDKLGVLSEGESVEVRGEAIGEWQPVNCAGIGGYVHTSLISWEPIATDDGGRRGGRSRGNGGGGSGGGDSIASFAMQYVGYPYAYAGEGPYAFDCSGFTKFVIQNTLGMDITHDMFTQIGMGQSVGMDDLQSGDLVFFANTFRPGLSHTGVYSGGGRFVHAENESTGVIVSDLYSDYYGSRWAGGTRLA